MVLWLIRFFAAQVLIGVLHSSLPGPDGAHAKRVGKIEASIQAPDTKG